MSSKGISDISSQSLSVALEAGTEEAEAGVQVKKNETLNVIEECTGEIFGFFRETADKIAEVTENSSNPLAKALNRKAVSVSKKFEEKQKKSDEKQQELQAETAREVLKQEVNGLLKDGATAVAVVSKGMQLLEGAPVPPAPNLNPEGQNVSKAKGKKGASSQSNENQNKPKSSTTLFNSVASAIKDFVKPNVEVPEERKESRDGAKKHAEQHIRSELENRMGQRTLRCLEAAKTIAAHEANKFKQSVKDRLNQAKSNFQNPLKPINPGRKQ